MSGVVLLLSRHSFSAAQASRHRCLGAVKVTVSAQCRQNSSFPYISQREEARADARKVSALGSTSRNFLLPRSWHQKTSSLLTPRNAFASVVRFCDSSAWDFSRKPFISLYHGMTSLVTVLHHPPHHNFVFISYLLKEILCLFSHAI